MTKKIINEYPNAIDLTGDSSLYIKIPESLFLASNTKEHLIAVYSYFFIKRGLDNTVNFSVNSIVTWMEKLPNRNKAGINRKIMNCINYLVEKNYLRIALPLEHASINEALFNSDTINEECNKNHFIILYLDELKKIINYKKYTSEKKQITYESILMLYLYLKLNTFKRPNVFLPEESTGNYNEDVNRRRLLSPEAFDVYLYQIGHDLDLASRVVSGAAKVLLELGLVYFKELPRYRYHDEWRTDHTIFAFMYKRERGQLLASGKSYYEPEIANKKKKLAEYRRKKNNA